jgi:hypothetical protein
MSAVSVSASICFVLRQDAAYAGIGAVDFDDNF